MILNLNYQIADEKLNPITLDIYNNIEKLKRIITRNKKNVPNISNKSESEIRSTLIQVSFLFHCYFSNLSHFNFYLSL